MEQKNKFAKPISGFWRQFAILLMMQFVCNFNYAQTYGEIAMYKAYFFDLGQDMSKAVEELNYTLLKRGTQVEIIEVDVNDLHHVVVKHKKKTGLIHTGALKDKSVLIPYFPQLRDEFKEALKNRIYVQGMSIPEASFIFAYKPMIWTNDKVKGTSFEKNYPLLLRPNITMLSPYSYDKDSNIKELYFYKGELCEINNKTGGRIGFETLYDIQLVNVSKPENVKEEFSEIKSIDIPNQKGKRYSYEDEYIKIEWTPLIFNFAFNIENKCNHSIKLPWDDMAFIDKNGQSKRLLNGDTKKINSDREQPNSIVPRGVKLNGYAVPMPQEKFFDFNYLSPKEYEDMGCILQGKKISILFPVIIQGVTNEYIFEFEVKGAYVIPYKNY